MNSGERDNRVQQRGPEGNLEEYDPRPCTCHPSDNPPRPCPGMYGLGACFQADNQRLRGLLRLALPMLKEHADYANSAPVWHCTGYEANTLNALIPEIEAALGPN